MDRKKLCQHCKRLFIPKPNIKNQRYCSDKGCQRARRREWQRQKMAQDPAYRENQERAQKKRMEQNPDYFRQYRDSHPDYVKRNRELQSLRDQKRRDRLATMDASIGNNVLNSGVYRIVKLTSDLATMDASKDIFYIIPEGYPQEGEFLATRT